MEQRKPRKIAKPRGGRDIICKELYYPTTESVLGLTINLADREIKLSRLLGPSPDAYDVLLSLLADRDIRRLICEYQKKLVRTPFKIWQRTGMSGCRDIFIQEFTVKDDNFIVTRKPRNICHISCSATLNKGLPRLKIDDFVELLSYLYIPGIINTTNVKFLRKESGVQYIYPWLKCDLEDSGFLSEFSNQPTKIL